MATTYSAHSGSAPKKPEQKPAKIEAKIIYYLSNGALDPNLVDGEAKKAAESFFIKRADGTIDENKSIKSSQLRKFYNEVKTLERQYENYSQKDLAFAEILPMIKLLKAKSEYALKRKVVPVEFRNWLWNHVDSVENEKDFQAFLLHFEAVVGFSYGYAPRNFA